MNEQTILDIITLGLAVAYVYMGVWAVKIRAYFAAVVCAVLAGTLLWFVFVWVNPYV